MYIHDLASSQVLVCTPTPTCILVSRPLIFLFALVVVLRMIRPKTLLGLDVDTFPRSTQWGLIHSGILARTGINALQLQLFFEQEISAQQSWVEVQGSVCCSMYWICTSSRICLAGLLSTIHVWWVQLWYPLLHLDFGCHLAGISLVGWFSGHIEWTSHCACVLAFHQGRHSSEKQATHSQNKQSDLGSCQLKIRPGSQVHVLLQRQVSVFL